jgi:MFS family permease
VVGVLVLAQASSFVDRMILGLLVGPIRQTFQISDTQFSLLAGFAFTLFYALMGIPLARIADRGSRRALIGIGIAVWSVMTALCGTARTFWGLFAARVGVGVGEATLGPAAFSLITDYFPRDLLARALSVYMCGVAVGSGVAYMVGGTVVAAVADLSLVTLPIVGEVHGWQLTFFIVGIPGLVIALLMLTVREPLRRGVAPDATHLPFRAVLAYVWRRRAGYGTLTLGVAVFVMVVYAFNIWGPTYFIRVFDYSPARAGWTFGTIMLVAGTGGLLVAGWWADTWRRRGRADAYVRTILVSIALMAPFAIALGFIDDPRVAVPVIFMAVFFSAFQGGLTGGALQLMTPNRMRGQVSATYFMVANLLGLGLGPTVVAACTDYVFGDDGAIGKSLALTAAVLCPLGAAILWSGLKSIRRVLDETHG